MATIPLISWLLARNRIKAEKITSQRLEEERLKKEKEERKVKEQSYWDAVAKWENAKRSDVTVCTPHYNRTWKALGRVFVNCQGDVRLKSDTHDAVLVKGKDIEVTVIETKNAGPHPVRPSFMMSKYLEVENEGGN